MHSDVVVAHDLERAVHDQLGRVDPVRSKDRGVIRGLPCREEWRREGVSPAEAIPVVDVITQSDDVHTCHWLCGNQAPQQIIGWRAARTALGGEQLYDD